MRWHTTLRCFTCLAVLFTLFAVAPAPVQAAIDCTNDTYTIQLGDSLYSIAIECEIPYAALVGINVELSDPDMIRPGQVIRLVAGVPLTAPPATGAPQVGGLQADGEYITRPGDSLARIAYLYRTNIPDILRENPQIRANRMLYPGQVIHLPRDAKWTKGWVGVNALIAESEQDIVVRVVDFPAYADIDLNVAQLDLDNTLTLYNTFEGKTDARGEAVVTVTLPFYAWADEEWVIEVITTELPDMVRSVSPIITIY
jgi:LysM repeat protein